MMELWPLQDCLRLHGNEWLWPLQIPKHVRVTAWHEKARGGVRKFPRTRASHHLAGCAPNDPWNRCGLSGLIFLVLARSLALQLGGSAVAHMLSGIGPPNHRAGSDHQTQPGVALCGWSEDNHAFFAHVNSTEIKLLPKPETPPGVSRGGLRILHPRVMDGARTANGHRPQAGPFD